MISRADSTARDLGLIADKTAWTRTGSGVDVSQASVRSLFPIGVFGSQKTTDCGSASVLSSDYLGVEKRRNDLESRRRDMTFPRPSKSSPWITALALVATIAFVSPPLVADSTEAGQEKTAQTKRKRNPAQGHWELTVDFNGNSIPALIAIGRAGKGERAGTNGLAGTWSTIFGSATIENLDSADGKLAFTLALHNPSDDGKTWKFDGKTERAKISGTLSDGEQEFDVSGKRAKRHSSVVGNWAMGFSDNGLNSELIVRPLTRGQFEASWRNHKAGTNQTINDFAVKKGDVTFTLDGKGYKGRMRPRDGILSGKVESDRGPIQIDAMRVGSAIVGDWDLALDFDGTPRKQRMTIRGDLSGWIGGVPIELKVDRADTSVKRDAVLSASLDGSKISFETEASFGDLTLVLKFEGKVESGKLTGELISSAGSAGVTGTKIEKGNKGKGQRSKKNAKKKNRKKGVKNNKKKVDDESEN